MPTYDYEILEGEHVGKTIELRHSIAAPAEDHAIVNGERVKVRRVISSAPLVHFIDGPSGGWSSTGYSKREHERQAEAVLGRKLVKAAR